MSTILRSRYGALRTEPEVFGHSADATGYDMHVAGYWGEAFIYANVPADQVIIEPATVAASVRCVDCGGAFPDTEVASAHWLAEHDAAAQREWTRTYGSES